MNKAKPQQFNNAPTILVVFGATGDLMAKKIVPALFHLFRKDKLPNRFKVIGFARRELSNEEFQKSILQILSAHKDVSVKTCEAFCKLFSYERGTFEDKKGYASLSAALKDIDAGWSMCSNKLFYLAVPPQFYENIFNHLASSGLTAPCSKEEGWSRVIVEKPFGKNLKTAEHLDELLLALFKEAQIYRIDHYLAKEMVQNILAFRFSNNLFEKTWDKNSIEKVEIKLWERIGVEDRGSFYDGIGALRDVGQNHLLQIVALLTMDNPIDFASESIRTKRTEAIKNLIAPSKEEIKQFVFRAQYDGYREIKGVDPDSNTETYFKARVFLSNPRWDGVPFILESGKKLKEQIKEAVITFRHPTPCLCPGGSTHYKNKLTIALEPEEKITLAFWSKKPGLDFGLEERDFSFLMRGREQKNQYTEEYEKLLYDCIVGDQTLFVTSGEVKAMWKYTDAITDAWQNNKVPLKTYPPASDQPIVESSYINEHSAVMPGSLSAEGGSASGGKKEIGIVGLGKMGGNIARRLTEKGWHVYGYNSTPETTKELEQEGLSGVYSLKELAQKLSSPRIVWLMVPAGKAVDEVIFGKNGLSQRLRNGDVIIDGGNSFYKDSVKRFAKLKKLGIRFIDAGVSGGPRGARYGASLMVGGEKEIADKLEPLFRDIAAENGYQFFEGAGAGHFVKMIHNGIEYGMMQSIAEGFAVLKEAKYKLDLSRVADVYNHGSVIESRLISWLKSAIGLHGEDLQDVSGSVGHTGEGAWTVKTAKELKVKTKVIEEALKFRIDSAKKPDYTGKVLSALREQFGGHKVK